MNNQEKQRDTDQALRSWNEWKVTCSVDNSSKETQDVLTPLIEHAFWRKLEFICPVDAKDIYNACDNWPYEFDCGICRPAPDLEKSKNMKKLKEVMSSVEFESIKKCFKDYVWALQKYSADDKLKVIEGTLIGPNSLINGITVKYLYTNYPTVYFNYKENRSLGKMKPTEEERDEATSKEENNQTKRQRHPFEMVSLESRIKQSNDNSDGKNLEDVIEDQRVICYQDKTQDIVREYNENLKAFSREEIAIILAKIAKMVASKETQAFVGWGDEKIKCYWNNILRKKCCDPRYYVMMRKKITIVLMKNRLMTEKDSASFLMVFEEKLKRKTQTKEEREGSI